MTDEPALPEAADVREAAVVLDGDYEVLLVDGAHVTQVIGEAAAVIFSQQILQSSWHEMI